jgi:hypothetical protein
MDVHQRLAALGTAVPEIMLPGPEVNLEKWAVIACDQFTQDRGYWEQVKSTVGDAPSALNLVFPEIFLGDPDRGERIHSIGRTMDSYVGTILAPPRRGCVYLERSTRLHQRRRGLLVALDLEQYDWKDDSRLLIRCTEGTVPERLVPRMDIRRGAKLEIPHILILIDDAGDTLLPSMGERAKKAPPLYETTLMMGSGSLKGWILDSATDWMVLAEGLEELAEKSKARCGDRPFLYAAGDGNHSLAAAKAVWEEYKENHAGKAGLMDHPARWVLVEVENLYDPGLSFEPIHRLILNADPAAVLDCLSRLPGFGSRSIRDRTELSALVGDKRAENSRCGFIAGTNLILIESAGPGLTTRTLQPLLDAFAAGTGCLIDYIHGEEELFRLAGKPRTEGYAVGLLLPPVKKTDLFTSVAAGGPLPRKSFSMGEAEEKRFYLECRSLFG